MKDLLAKMLALLPAYGMQVIELVSGPKAFIARRDLASPTAIRKALTFAGLSFGLAFIAQVPLLAEKQDKEWMFGVLAIQAALGFLLNVAILALSWRLVGGRLAWKKFIAVTCYFSGISTLLFVGVSLLAAGAFNLLDSVHFKQMLNGAALDPDELLASLGFRVYLVIVGVGLLAVYTWIFFIWGAYRELNRLSKLRSGIALAIFLTLSPFQLLIGLLMNASAVPLHPGTKPTLPAELAGTWLRKREATSGGVHSGELITYAFFPGDTYFIIATTGSTNGRCLRMTTRRERGRVTAEGSMLAFTPRERSEVTDDGCSGRKWEANLELAKEVCRYELHRRTTGWELCLAGRFGETCLTPGKQ
jgi:hypothetical protein